MHILLILLTNTIVEQTSNRVYIDDFIHELCRYDDFIKDRYTAPDQSSVPSLWYHGQLPLITVSKNVCHFRCISRPKNYFTYT